MVEGRERSSAGGKARVVHCLYRVVVGIVVVVVVVAITIGVVIVVVIDVVVGNHVPAYHGNKREEKEAINMKIQMS